MQLVCKIPDELYKKWEQSKFTLDEAYQFVGCVMNGKPIDESFEWCTDCKEYDHSRHCCPRWTKVIRTTLNDSINAVLDEIRAEFKRKANSDDWYHTTDGLVWGEAIEILDKHRAGDSGAVKNTIDNGFKPML